MGPQESAQDARQLLGMFPHRQSVCPWTSSVLSDTFSSQTPRPACFPGPSSDVEKGGPQSLWFLWGSYSPLRDDWLTKGQQHV